MLFGFGQRLPLLELVHHLLQHLGMAQQIVLDDALDLAALRAEKDCARAGARAGKASGERESAAANGRRSRLHCRSPSGHQAADALCGGL